MDEFVSIAMPAYNAEKWIGAAIRSVLEQTHSNWELFVVDDGSTDGTAEVMRSFDDPRIILLHKGNGGIGSARNMALDRIKGSFFCCLDADDVLPPRSIEARLQVFRNDPDLGIVDGQVLFMDSQLRRVTRTYLPETTDNPFHELITFSGRCFMGPSWMVRWPPERELRYEENISHAEDFFFCLEYGQGKRFGVTSEVILLYRRTGVSSMTTNIEGMERSMIWIGKELRKRGIASEAELALYKRKRRRMLAGSFWHAGKRLKALRALFR